MKKTDIISGSILEIPLDKNYGFGYIKLIFLGDIVPRARDYKIIKPYNILRKVQMNKNEYVQEKFETDDIFMFPLLMHGFPNIRGPKKWSYVGQTNLTLEDKVCPDFLSTGTHLSKENLLEELDNNYGVQVIRFPEDDIYIKDYDAIFHLGKWQHSSPEAIRTLLTMQWMKKNDENILDYYTESDFKEDFWLGYAYNQIMLQHIDFMEIKFKNRLKARQ